MPNTTSITDRVRICGALGFPSTDFFISEEMHALAVRIASRNACLCFVGLLPDERAILSTDRLDLLEMGCTRIAWIARDGSAV